MSGHPIHNRFARDGATFSPVLVPVTRRQARTKPRTVAPYGQLLCHDLRCPSGISLPNPLTVRNPQNEHGTYI